MRLLALKQRPIDKGLILVAAEFAQLSAWLLPMSEDLRIQVTASWPGPTTWLLPAAAHVPKYLCGAHDTLAVRVSAHPIVRELCLAFGGPLVSTSANKANQAPARDAQQVKEMFAEQIDGLLDGSLGGQEQPTEIRDGRTGQIIRSSNSL